MRTTFLFTLGLIAGLGCKRDQADAAMDSTAAAAPTMGTDTMAPDTMGAPLDDPTIVAIFDMANTFDIETSQLALEKSQNQEVRALARQFANDHQLVRQQGRDLAAKLGVTPPVLEAGPLSQHHQAAMTDLRAQSGADFDRAYVNHEVKYHQEVISAIQNNLMPAIQNAELRALVEQVAPAFQAHLSAAQTLQSKLGS